MITTDINKLKTICKDASLLEAPEIIKKLEYELKNSKSAGIGLAAIQIGIEKRICILRASDKIDLINPIIVAQYDLMEFHDEGCLSFPYQFITTKRYNEVFIKDLLHPAGIILVGLDAVLAEHEIDHLNGKTMYDHQIKIPRVNDKCWCGSDKKYKKCHMNKIIK